MLVQFPEIQQYREFDSNFGLMFFSAPVSCVGGQVYTARKTFLGVGGGLFWTQTIHHTPARIYMMWDVQEGEQGYPAVLNEPGPRKRSVYHPASFPGKNEARTRLAVL